ncbi:MAG: glycosyltransferase [Phycisphaerales bacterium]
MGRAADRDLNPARHGPLRPPRPGALIEPLTDHPAAPGFTRMDMHCHSRASDGPATAALGLIGCPECYSPPERVYEQAVARGMDLVTITDHDTITGAQELLDRGFPNVVVGEEVTVHFPEDRCRLHVLVWGLSPEQHEEIGRLRLRDDVYAFAEWLADDNLPHALAHPLYIQNGKLTRAHVEKCTLLFKCFETLNGAHTGLHRGVLERFLGTLTPATVQAMANAHGLRPLWPRVWDKACTGGSDDHGLLNVGRTWTAVENEGGIKVTDPKLFLRRVMSARCEPGGVAGHSSLLAHQLATVGAHFAAERLVPRLRPRARLIASRVLRFAGAGVPTPSKMALLVDSARAGLRRLRRGRRRTPAILTALRDTLGPVLDRHPAIRDRLAAGSWVGGTPLGDHERMPEFLDDLVAAATRAVFAGAFGRRRGSGAGCLLDGAGAASVLLGAQLPYIVSLFQQNKERPFLDAFDHETWRTGRRGTVTPLERPMRVCLFTDTLGDVNGVSRFIQNAAQQARASGRDLTVLTSTRFRVPDGANIVNFEPVLARAMPRYENLEMVLPPVLRMLRYVDRMQPDVIHVSTPGSVGIVGAIAARMLRVPMVGVYHTDFPAYIDHLFDDAAFTWATSAAMKLFYGPFAAIFTRSEDYRASLAAMGVPSDRLLALRPGIDPEAFQARYRDETIWAAHGADPASVKVLSVGRVSVEKNLPLLTKVWKRVRTRCAARGLNAELIVVGDGPYRATMEQELAGHGARFLGFRHGRELATIYASADLFVFPSTTDTLGQVVMEAGSSGLPVLVSDRGGPKEVVEQERTGLVLDADDPDLWVKSIVDLVADEPRRRAMGRAGHEMMQGMSFASSFDHFWEAHERVWHDRLAALGITSARAAAPGEPTPV